MNSRVILLLVIAALDTALVVLVTLKLAGVTDLSWLVVTAPFTVPTALFLMASDRRAVLSYLLGRAA